MRFGNSSFPSTISGIRTRVDYAIFSLDVYELIERCDAVLCNLNGRVPDEGMIVEAALAYAAGKPLVLFKDDARAPFGGYDNSMLTSLVHGKIVRKLKELSAALKSEMSHKIDLVPLSGDLKKAISYGKRISSAMEHLPKNFGKKQIRKARNRTTGILGVNIMVALSNYADIVETSSREKIDVIFSGAGLPLHLPGFFDLKEDHPALVPIVSSGKAASIIARQWQRKYDYIPDAVRRGAVAPAANAAQPAPAAATKSAVEDLFRSPEAEAVKEEICAVGRKLWMRQYVDGNGGNISYRLGPNAFLCTPTLLSKYDLRPQDIGMVDIEGKQIAGARARTSEILMHLEIYKEVPEAKGIVHCHPAHATAYAITGRVPPTCVIPEFEVFIGKVALSPYETPGTPEFARTVIPFVKNHNTLLLANHGIVCWADTVTHAEWYAEVVDTYCWTLMLASQLGVPISQISERQTTDLLDIKKKLGLPDARTGIGPANDSRECRLCDLP